MPLKSGRYVIANVKQRNFACLPDDNDNTPVNAFHSRSALHAQWDVKRLDNGRYFIQNAEYVGRYANAGHRGKKDATVEGWAKEQQWDIELRVDEQYTITMTDTGWVWTLDDKGLGTSVTLSSSYNDKKCWWIFENPYVAEESHHDKVGEQPFRDKINEEPPHDTFDGEKSGDRAAPNLLLDIELSISQATDLRNALKATTEALRKALELTQTRAKTNKKWEISIKRLLFHIDTIENQIERLEDFIIDGVIPLDPTVIGPLETYAGQLNTTYQLLCENKPDEPPEIPDLPPRFYTFYDKYSEEYTWELDEEFEKYTTALHEFAARSILQMIPEPRRSQPIIRTPRLGRFEKVPEQDDTYLQKGMSTIRSLVGIDSHQPPKATNGYGFHHDTCLQGTREKSQEAIRKWFNEETTAKSIFLILDVAGSGKSTIANHMAEEWKRENRMVATFFFSRDTAFTMNTASFCSTVADAFIALDRKLQAPVEAFRKRPDFGLLSFWELFNGLVIGPLQILKRDAILIIDGLDECNNEDGSREELLNAIQSQRVSKQPLRILATGRPEPDIKLWAQESRVEYANFVQLEGGYNDVQIYIKYRLQHHHRNREDLCSIVPRTDGAFIWARIACDLIYDNADASDILGEIGKEASLDDLYRVTLDHSISKNERYRQVFRVVLQMILASREPLSIEELELISPTSGGIVEQITSRLGSLLLFNGRKDPIRFLNATFREFLTTQSKAGAYFIRPELGHHILALACLEILSHYYETLRGIDDLARRAYVYSSKSWVYHCMASYRNLGLYGLILKFSKENLRVWAVLSDDCHPLDTHSCLRDALFLAHQKMSPEITETVTRSSLSTVRVDILSYLVHNYVGNSHFYL